MPSKPVVITIFNNKGGVAKTTTTISLACSLASEGFSVGMIDLDAQGHLESFWETEEPRQDIVTIIKKSKTLKTFIQKSDFRELQENLFLLPNDKDITEGLFYSIFPKEEQNMERYNLIPSLLSKLEGFDYILIETPPNLENRSIGAILSANFLVIPTALEKWSIENIINVIDNVNNLKNVFPSFDLPHIGTIYTRVGKIKKLLNRTYANYAETIGIQNLGYIYESSDYQEAIAQPPYFTSVKCRSDYDSVSKKIQLLCQNQIN